MCRIYENISTPHGNVLNYMFLYFERAKFTKYCLKKQVVLLAYPIYLY